MTDAATAARTAREKLAQGLAALQSAVVPPGLPDPAEPVAEAMSALFGIESSGGTRLVETGPVALNAARRALSILQSYTGNDPGMERALEVVAESLGLVHATMVALRGPESVKPPPAVAVARSAAPAAGFAATQLAASDPSSPPGPAAAAPQGAASTGRRPPPKPKRTGAQRELPATKTQPIAEPAPAVAPAARAPAQPQPHVPAAARMPQQAAAFVQAAPAAQPVQQPAFAQPVQRPAPAPQPAFAQSAPQPAAFPAQAPGAHVAAAVQQRPATTSGRPQLWSEPSNLIRIEAELGAHSSTNFYKGLSGNDVVDSGGLFVATYQIPSLGQPVLLRVSLPGGYEFEARGVVRWTRDSIAASPDAPPGFGAQLTEISPEGRQLVYRYVRNREPLFHDDL